MESRAQAVGGCDEGCQEEADVLRKSPGPCVHLPLVKGKLEEAGFRGVKDIDHSV